MGYYWVLFDGYGGFVVVILVVNILYFCFCWQLEVVVEGMMVFQFFMYFSGCCVCFSDFQFVEEKGIQVEDLVIGVLENVFQECDDVIGRELEVLGQVGGCIVLVVVFL